MRTYPTKLTLLGLLIVTELVNFDNRIISLYNLGGNLLVFERRFTRSYDRRGFDPCACFISAVWSQTRGLTGYVYILLAMELPHSANMVSTFKRDNSA